MLENKDDKKIVNLLENENPMRAIKVDFQDLNNKTLVIQSSFKEAYKHLDDEDKKDKWFYISEIDSHSYSVSLKGLVAFDINPENNYLNLYWLEVNKIFLKTGMTKKILNYLKEYCKYAHLNGILLKCNSSDDISLFKKFDFEYGNNSLIMRWKI